MLLLLSLSSPPARGLLDAGAAGGWGRRGRRGLGPAVRPSALGPCVSPRRSLLVSPARGAVAAGSPRAILAPVAAPWPVRLGEVPGCQMFMAAVFYVGLAYTGLSYADARLRGACLRGAAALRVPLLRASPNLPRNEAESNRRCGYAADEPPSGESDAKIRGTLRSCPAQRPSLLKNLRAALGRGRVSARFKPQHGSMAGSAMRQIGFSRQLGRQQHCAWPGLRTRSSCCGTGEGARHP